MKKDITEHNRLQVEYFEKNYKARMEPRDSPYVRRQVGMAMAYSGLRPPQRLLEVGCGMGRYTFALAKLGFEVEGLDLTPKLLERFRAFESGPSRIPLHCGDIASPAPELRGRFDALIGFFVLHHMHDLRACFRGMSSVLRPGGTLLFIEPNPYNPLYYLQIAITPGMTWEGDKGILDMRKKLLLGAMHEAGLEAPDCRRFGFLPPSLVNLPGGLACEGVLERLTPPPLRPFQLFLAKKPRALPA